MTWFFLIALSVPFWSLSHPLIEVDDARYAEVPREMLAQGSWAVPKLDAMDYVEKPPLFYWTQILSYKILGVGEGAARLPLALLSALGILITAWLGAWLFNRETGLLAGIFLSSSGLYFFLSHYLTLDLALSVFLLGSFALMMRALVRPEDRPWAVSGAWVFSALAFLTKGLIGIVFPAGWLILTAAFFPRQRKAALRFLKGPGPILFLLITAPWFIAMEKRRPGFFEFFFWDQHFLRFLTPQYNRQSPWYFFFLVFPAAVLPWTPLVLSGMAKGASEFKNNTAEGALLTWILMIIGFFSPSHSKLATYILPTLPQACLLAARRFNAPIESWIRKPALFVSAILLAAAFGGLFLNRLGLLTKYLPPYLPDPGGNVFLAAAILFLIAAAIYFSLQNAEPEAQRPARRLLWRPLACSWGIGLVLLAAFQIDRTALSAKDVSSFILRFEKPGDLLYSYGTYLHGIPFYLRHDPDRVINWTGELDYAKGFKKNLSRFGYDSNIRPEPGKQVFIVLRRFEAPYVLGLLAKTPMRGNRLFFSGPWACFDVY